MREDTGGRRLHQPSLVFRSHFAALHRALTEVDHALGDGRRLAVSAPTLRRWLRTWRVGGFEALVPGLRRQPNRIPTEVLELAVTMKQEAPRRTAAQVARALMEAGQGKVSARTLQRHFTHLGLNVRPDGMPQISPASKLDRVVNLPVG